jgi:hypothetical protein
LFTAILRKSQLNLQACVEIGLIETALHELEQADQICAGKLNGLRLQAKLILKLIYFLTEM